MKKIKIVLVGYGNMGRDWGKILKKQGNIDLIGVIDLLKKNRAEAQKDLFLKDSQVSDKLEEFLDHNPDAIVDSSSPLAHFKNTRMALNNSVHVLGEKPMSLSLKQAEELISLSRLKKKIYMVNQNYRRNPVLEIVKKELNKLGKINFVNIDYYQNLEFKDTFRYSIEHPLLLDMSIHHFDLVRHLLNKNADSVYAIEYNPAGSKFKNGAGVFANFRIKDIAFNYRGSWKTSGANTSFNGLWRIEAKHGVINWDGYLKVLLERRLNQDIVVKKILIPSKFRFSPYELFLYELEESFKIFLNSISSGTEPDSSCRDNINSLKMVLAAIESSRNDQVVKIR